MSYTIQKLSKIYSTNLEVQAAAIAKLAGEIWREHYTPIIGAEQVEYMLEKFQSAQQITTDVSKNGHIYFTARKNRTDELVGYCAVMPKDGHIFLSKCYVHNNFRGNGVARGFLDEVIALCKMDYGYRKIRLTVNKNNIDAIAFYKKIGFETVDSVKTDIGGGFFMDDYVMELGV